MELTAKIIQIGDIQEGTSRTGNPCKKFFLVLETTDQQYPRKACFTVFGSDRVNQYHNTLKVNETVRVSFDIESREYNGRWYTDLNAWRIDHADNNAAAPAQSAAPAYQGPSPAPAPVMPAAPLGAGNDEDLPF